jgi:hypothetical protein
MAPEERERLYERLAEEFCEDPAVARGTMMGFPCLRVGGEFFASLERSRGNLIVKLSAVEVSQLIESGSAAPFAPAGRAFREWAEIQGAEAGEWRSLMNRARKFVQNLDS